MFIKTDSHPALERLFNHMPKIGSLPTFTKHFGILLVRGFNLVPNPAASSNALKVTLECLELFFIL